MVMIKTNGNYRKVRDKTMDNKHGNGTLITMSWFKLNLYLACSISLSKDEFELLKLYTMTVYFG